MNNKSVIFLINGLGIEKKDSYNISIDQCMPKLSKTKETSFFTTAVISSLEYRSAYQQFFLGDTHNIELKYLKEHIVNDQINNNPTYQNFVKSVAVPNSKLHVFIEPTNDRVVEAINDLVNMLTLEPDKKVFLHLILSQQTVNEYQKLIGTINYIKYNLSTHITVGFIIGKEYFSEEMTKDEMDFAKKLFFYCSAERWSETDKKLLSLKEANIRPCEVPGFCALNTCNIVDGDTILFFNTNRTSYDKFINAIYSNASNALRKDDFSLPIYSIIHLDTKFNVPSFSENIVYENSLANRLTKINKKCLIIAQSENMQLVNFIANGLNYVNNPSIQFMKLDFATYQNPNNVKAVIDNSNYDLIIFDFHMDVSKTINDLKAQLENIDIVLGNVADTCVNKYSLFITSLYGIKKTLPLASYNTETVTINYEMQIPIFFFDYRYLRSKYMLFPGETDDILSTALWCIEKNANFDTLIKEKGFLNNIFGLLKKKK